MNSKQSLVCHHTEIAALSLYFQTESIVLEEMVGGNRVFEPCPLGIMNIVSRAWTELVITAKSLSNPWSVNNYSGLVRKLGTVSDTYMALIEETYSCPQATMWIELHKVVTLKYLARVIIDAEGNGGFEKVLSSFSECLNYTLFELHELDTLSTAYNKETGGLTPFFIMEVDGNTVRKPDRRHESEQTPFLAFDRMSVRYIQMFATNPLMVRYAAYKKYFGFAPKVLHIRTYVEPWCDIEGLACEPLRALGITVTAV
jgi:hypothetical protein